MLKRCIWFIVISMVLVVHIGVSTKYGPIPDNPEMFGWFNFIQRFLPVTLLVLLIPRVQRVLNYILHPRVTVIIAIMMAVTMLTVYFTVESQRWFAWTTLALLLILMTFVADSQHRIGNTASWLLGGMVALLAMGVWECVYQVGLWFYYDFFGCSFTSFYTTIAMQFTWIIPALLAILVLYQRGLRFRPSNLMFACLGVSVASTVWWFATGMDIPLLFWQGHFVEVNEAARPLLISVSRASQSFWLVGVALYFGTPNYNKEVLS